MKPRRRLPTVSHGEDAALEYVKNYFDEAKNSSRKSIMARIAWNRRMVMGDHWSEPACIIKPGAETYHFNAVYRNGDRNLPRRTDNMVGEGVKNLVDRITRKQYEPSTRANARTPELEAAAKLRRDLLIHDQKKANWKAEIDRPLVAGIITDGPGFGRVFWDETYDALTLTSATGAQKCQSCGATLSDPMLGMKDAMAWKMGGPESADAPGFRAYMLERAMGRGEKSEDGSVKLGACPACEDAEMGKLAPYNPTPEEAEGGKDYFGRPLGSKVFTGEPIWELPFVFDMYPENGGFVSPRELKIMGQATIRSMQWVEARVDPKVFASIEPEDPHELMKHHPTLGHQWFRNGRVSSDENTFSDHVRVYEISALPIESGGDAAEDGLRWGRYIRVIGGKLCRNEALMREVPETDEGEGPRRVAISQYFVSGAQEVRGQVWFRTPVDDARPLNIRLNELLSMQDDIARRGIPIVATPDGIEWEAVRDRQTGAFNRYTYNGAAAHGSGWKPKDSIVTPNEGASHILQEPIDDTRERIRNLLGPMPIEAGEAGGAESAIQAQLQAEQAAQKLNQIDEARVHIEEGMLQAYADMIWAFRKEGGEYERENEAGEFENDSYDETMLLGEAKVTLEAKGTTDESLLQAEKSKQAQADGLYGDPAQWDQETIDDLLELRGLPKLSNVQSIQVVKAKAAWSDFTRDREVIYIDKTIQDTWIWFQVLGKLWQSDEGEEIQDSVGWEDVLRKISGWERKLATAEAQDMAARGLYEGHPPQEWEQIEADFNAKAEDVSKTATDAAALTGVPAPPPAVAPQPPPTGEFLPDSLCERLLMLWRTMLGSPGGVALDGVTPTPPQPMVDPEALPPEQKNALDLQATPEWKQITALNPVLRMYAVIQECRLEAERKRMQPMAIAAPGGGSTPSGGVPVPGAPVQPATGVDQAVRGVA